MTRKRSGSPASVGVHKRASGKLWVGAAFAARTLPPSRHLARLVHRSLAPIGSHKAFWPPRRRCHSLHAHPAPAEFLDDAVVRDGLADHSGDAWLSGRFILRTRLRPVNEWRLAVTSSCLCKHGEGAGFPFQIESLEDGVNDSIHTFYVHKAHHGSGSPPHFHEAALDQIRGAEFPPQVPGKA